MNKVYAKYGPKVIKEPVETIKRLKAEKKKHPYIVLYNEKLDRYTVYERIGAGRLVLVNGVTKMIGMTRDENEIRMIAEVSNLEIIYCDKKEAFIYAL